MNKKERIWLWHPSCIDYPFRGVGQKGQILI